jgi:hypothetical protein
MQIAGALGTLIVLDGSRNSDYSMRMCAYGLFDRVRPSQVLNATDYTDFTDPRR